LRSRRRSLVDVRVPRLRDPASLTSLPVSTPVIPRSEATRDLLFTLLLTLLLVGCGRASPDVSWHNESGFRWRALDVPSGSRVGFTALSAGKTGLNHRNDVDDEHALANRNLLIGAGIAI